MYLGPNQGQGRKMWSHRFLEVSEQKARMLPQCGKLPSTPEVSKRVIEQVSTHLTLGSELSSMDLRPDVQPPHHYYIMLGRWQMERS